MVLVSIKHNLLLLYLTVFAIYDIIFEVDYSIFVASTFTTFTVLKHGQLIFFDIINFPGLSDALFSNLGKMHVVLMIRHLLFQEFFNAHRLI